ncbi:MAG: hypothetical protein K2H85_04480, partial [Allobaculum sp.]|nr:hypothetical protein [Allobaculum sp.]
SLAFAEKMEETTLSKTNLDDPSQGSLTIQIGSQTFNNVTTKNFSLGSFPYEGKEITPVVNVTWTPKDEGPISFVEGQDFSIIWKNNMNVGKGKEDKATGELKFLGSYLGATRNVEFQITPINLNKGTVITLESDSYSLTSNDSEIKPQILSVEVGSLFLIEGTDYTMEYSNNNQVGTGTVTITGKRNFEGSASKRFSISGITLNGIEMTLPAFEKMNTTSGSLDAKDKVILQDYLNEEMNPHHYDYIVDNASIQTVGNTAHFKMSVSAKLKDESVVDLVLTDLESRYGSEVAMEEGVEETKASSYEIIDEKNNGKKVTIKRITAQEAFRVNGKLNSTAIRNILREDYEVEDVDFSSSQGKDSKFELKNLQDRIVIKVTTSKKATSNSTTPVSGNGTDLRPSTSIDSNVVKKTVYRFYNRLTGEHFYTSSEAERNELMKDSRWINEGQGWIAPETSDFPIYRVCNPNSGEHHFTIDKNEYETLQALGWKGEGIGYYSADPSKGNIIPLYRLYNPQAKDAGSHHYTESEGERDALVKQGWNSEGVAWYGMK